MLKKRIIFTLLHDNGSFMLSRNFRLQKVGNLDWLEKNYNFKQISSYIDELIVLDVTRENRNIRNFAEMLKKITNECFVPISAGGGVCSPDDARLLLRSGADKVVLNTSAFSNYEVIKTISKEFGQQCIVASIDLKKENKKYSVFINNGTKKLKSLNDKMFLEGYIGEIYLNSIDRDGTGQGYDFSTLEIIPTNCKLPIILAGGVGNAEHLKEGLINERIDAVATAHLFNFVGTGLKNARDIIQSSGIPLARWPQREMIL